MAVMNNVASKLLKDMDVKDRIALVNNNKQSGNSLTQDIISSAVNKAKANGTLGNNKAVTQPAASGTVVTDPVTQTKNALDAWQKPVQGTSAWMEGLTGVIDKIMNGEKFSYDLNGDALYQQYKDQYITQGQQAMMDTIGQASALTGGYGNSYAQSVGQQTYQGHLQELNNKIPELYQLALDQYNRERDELYRQYSLLSEREQTDYDRYRDTVSDAYIDRDYLTGRYDTERDFDYRIGRDAVEDSHWQSEFDRMVERDAIADKQWDMEFNEGVRQYDTNIALTKEQMQIQQTQWQAEFNETVRQANNNYLLEEKRINEDIRHNKITEEQGKAQLALAKQELEQQKVEAANDYAYKMASLNTKSPGGGSTTKKTETTKKTTKTEEPAKFTASGKYGTVAYSDAQEYMKNAGVPEKYWKNGAIYTKEKWNMYKYNGHLPKNLDIYDTYEEYLEDYVELYVEQYSKK